MVAYYLLRQSSQIPLNSDLETSAILSILSIYLKVKIFNIDGTYISKGSKKIKSKVHINQYVLGCPA